MWHRHRIDNYYLGHLDVGCDHVVSGGIVRRTRGDYNLRDIY